MAAVHEKVRKRVQFAPGTKDEEPTGGAWRPPKRKDRAWQDRTGRGTKHLAEGPASGAHPLKDPDLLGKDSEDLAKRVKRNFYPDERAGMAGALLVGDSTETSSSMRRGRSTLHPVVREILDELAGSGGQMGAGHGQCAEVGAISNHLFTIDPRLEMTRSDARKYFEETNSRTVAHQSANFRLTPACASCAYLTEKLCILAEG